MSSNDEPTDVQKNIEQYEEHKRMWEELGEHGFKEDATYVLPDPDREGLHSLWTICRRGKAEGYEPHFRVGYWSISHKSSAKFAGQWLTDEEQSAIDWEWTCDYSKLWESEHKTWDDVINEISFKPSSYKPED